MLSEGIRRRDADARERMFGEEALWHYKRGLARARLGRRRRRTTGPGRFRSRAKRATGCAAGRTPSSARSGAKAGDREQARRAVSSRYRVGRRAATIRPARSEAETLLVQRDRTLDRRYRNDRMKKRRNWVPRRSSASLVAASSSSASARSSRSRPGSSRTSRSRTQRATATRKPSSTTCASSSTDAPPLLELTQRPAGVHGRTPTRSRLQNTQLQTLHVLAWDPDDEKLARVAVPFWLLRLKSSRFEFSAYASGLRRQRRQPAPRGHRTLRRRHHPRHHDALRRARPPLGSMSRIERLRNWTIEQLNWAISQLSNWLE